MQAMGNISARGRICQEPWQGKGRIGSTSGQQEERTAQLIGNAFLKHRFSAEHLCPHRELMAWRKVEREYFRSLANLCAFYGLDEPDVTEIPYPQNIVHSLQQVSAGLNACSGELELLLLQKDNGRTVLATAKCYATGNKIFYLPVTTLHRLWKGRERIKTVRLAMSLCAYIYQVLDIPFYADESSYLWGTYQTLQEWFMQGEDEWTDEEAHEELMSELLFIQSAGEQVRAEISKKQHLERLEIRTAAYIPHNENERRLRSVCYQACSLKRDFPERSLMASMSADVSEDPSENHLYAEMFIGFYWGGESDVLDEHLMNYLNDHFCECSSGDEARAFQFFNRKPKKECHDLSFEKRAFELLDSAAYTLFRI
jgi:hypothetical protein